MDRNILLYGKKRLVNSELNKSRNC